MLFNVSNVVQLADLVRQKVGGDIRIMVGGYGVPLGAAAIPGDWRARMRLRPEIGR